MANIQVAFVEKTWLIQSYLDFPHESALKSAAAPKRQKDEKSVFSIFQEKYGSCAQTNEKSGFYGKFPISYGFLKIF